MPSRDPEPRTDLFNPEDHKRNGKITNSIANHLKRNGTLTPDPTMPESSFGTAAGDVLRGLRQDGFTIHDDEGEIPEAL